MKDVEGVTGTTSKVREDRQNDGRTDECTHGRMRVISIVTKENNDIVYCVTINIVCLLERTLLFQTGTYRCSCNTVNILKFYDRQV